MSDENKKPQRSLLTIDKACALAAVSSHDLQLDE